MLVPYICYGTYAMVADEWALRVLRLDDVSVASQLDDLGDEFFKVWACQSKVRPNVSPEQSNEAALKRNPNSCIY